MLSNTVEIFTEAHEKQMGLDITYTFHEEFECDNCGNNISFEIRCFEYPVVFLEDRDKSCDGGSFMEEPQIDVLFE